MGLKHRGTKGKLEVKIRTAAINEHEGNRVAGMEKWVKYKLGKGTKGFGEEEVKNRQLIELGNVLKDHHLFDPRVYGSLKEQIQERESRNDTTPMSRGLEVQQQKSVDKRRVVGVYTGLTLIGDGKAGKRTEVHDRQVGLAGRVLAHLGLEGHRGQERKADEERQRAVEVMIEDCLLKVWSEGSNVGKRESIGWRTFAVEGKEKDVQAFLSDTALGRWIYAGGQNSRAAVVGYPGFLISLDQKQWEEQGREEYGRAKEEHWGGAVREDQAGQTRGSKEGMDLSECSTDPARETALEAQITHVHGSDRLPEACPIAAAAVAAVTASRTFPIPPLPTNPYRGVKKAFKLKQISLVVMRHPDTGKFLAVEETKGKKEGLGFLRREHLLRSFLNMSRTLSYLIVPSPSDKGWWLPAGHVDPGETFTEAAYRETLEEAGIGVVLRGILCVEHKLSSPSAGRLRVIFLGEPIHPTAPLKSVADEESIGARWVTVQEMKAMRLRGNELMKWAEYVEKGGSVYPLSLLAEEG